jgi:transcriptional regulator with XRE-family HTH domain
MTGVPPHGVLERAEFAHRLRSQRQPIVQTPSLTPLPDFPLRLRRLRRARGFKQAYVAALLGIDQSTVSRWEAGTLAPDADLMERALQVLGSVPADDCALRRLVRSSSVACHLVTDADHRLLAVSEPRQREWERPAAELMGTSLWRFATPEIAAAEAELDALQWWDLAAPSPVVLHTREAWTDGLHILEGDMVWERVWLASGEPARLCMPLHR